MRANAMPTACDRLASMIDTRLTAAALCGRLMSAVPSSTRPGSPPAEADANADEDAEDGADASADAG